MESGVLRNECEPEARAAGSRVHRKSGPPPPVRSDPTLNAWARHCTALQAQCFTGPTLESGNTQAPGGIRSFPVPTPEAWARHCTALQAQCFTGPTLQSGDDEEAEGKATLNLFFPLVLFPHAAGVGPVLHWASSAVAHWAYSLEWEDRNRVRVDRSLMGHV